MCALFEGLREIGQVASAISKIVKRADCVIARLPSVIGLLSAAASVRHGKPLAVEVVGNAWEANIYHGARIGPIIAPIEHLICKAFVKRAKISIYITTDYLQRVYPTKGHVFVCPNVQIDEIVPADRVKGRLVKSASSKWIFGLVGSLDVSYKGHETAITALAKLKQSLPQADLRLQFAGGGDPARWERLAIAAGVSENVDFLGTISPGEPMRRWYDSVDIVMQPSQVEAQGRAIIEAMSRGKPVVATRTGGIPELISEDCLVRVADANELAERTSALVRNSAHYEAIALRNLTASRAFLKPAIERQRKKAFDCLRTQIDSVN